MADIAMVLHWGPADMENMELAELVEWRERARLRNHQQSGTGR